MKNLLKTKIRFLYTIALVALIGLSFAACGDGSSKINDGSSKINDGKSKNPDGLFILDISKFRERTGDKQSDWDYMIGNNKGNSVFLSTNESGSLPEKMYIKPDKNRDVGYTVFFEDNGLPEIIVHQDYILYFSKFYGYKYDVAVIAPDNTITSHIGVESDINFDAYTRRAASAHVRSVGSDIKDVLLPGNLLEAAGMAVDLASCAAAVIPPYVSAFPCIKFLSVQVLKVVSVVALDDLSEEAAIMLTEAFECVDGLGISNLLDAIAAADDCIGLLAHMAELLWQLDIDAIEGRFDEEDNNNEEVNDDNAFLLNNAPNYDIIVTAAWTGSGDIILNVKDPSGNNGGNLRNGTHITHRYWYKGEAPAGIYNVGIKPNMAWGNTLQVKVRILAFGKIKTYSAEIRQGAAEASPPWYKVASFDSNGNIWQ